MGRDEYYSKRAQRHREMADYHADMKEKGIHTEYHAEKEAHHRSEAEKILNKKNKKPSKKDIGPMSSGPNALGQT